MTTVVAGIDVGGTMIKLGLVRADGAVLARQRVPYASLTSFEQLVATLADQLALMETATGSRASGIGIAAPGYARPHDGVIVDGTANVPLLRNRSLAAALAERRAMPAVSINDGSAAALGELRFGAGRGLRRMALLTLGTGVGGGVVVDGNLVTGADETPPELGAIVVDDAPAGPRTLEQFASAGGFSAAYHRLGGVPSCTPAEICRRAQAGEPIALAAVDQVARRIAQAFGTLVNALNLEACVLGGGIAQAGAIIIDRVHAHLPDFAWPFLVRAVRVLPAETGEDAGVLGAAARFLGRGASPAIQ